ncbi:MAG: PIG-L family deacetylase [Abditibacteriota bacterium]|nr:PIG-L family deacetylase [Abditibacteriota bacterium]
MIKYIPDSNGLEPGSAVGKTTVLAVSAHQDDIEIMAAKGVIDCFGKDSRYFGAVIVTDGAGSPRDDLYADYTDEQMKTIRVKEQKKAAYVGEYSFCAFLGFTSAQVKDRSQTAATVELSRLIADAAPECVYTHNIFDKHPTHVATSLRVIEAINMLPASERPRTLLGCEVWRSLDWISDDKKIVLDVSSHENISNAILGVFDSQICGGKRYDLATSGRRRANATYLASHGTDTVSLANIAVDMTELITPGGPTPAEFAEKYLELFRQELYANING